MKKKIITGSCFILFIFILTTFFTGGFQHTISTGICYITDNGHVLVIVDDTPIEISNQSANEALFQDLKTGDKVMITHDGINESYPAQTGVYKLFKIDDHCINEVSVDTITQLEELGWISA